MISPFVSIDLSMQTLAVYDGPLVVRSYPVSTAANGPGEIMDSECTPRGKHVIDEKIGEDCPLNAVFVGRRATGEIYTPQLREQQPARDWILTRILWLRGTEPGRNEGDNVDSKARYIYIHGTPDDTQLSVPGSRGCIRMRNRDIVELYDLVEVGTGVELVE